MISGYQSRKFYAYDYSQGKSDEQQGTNACPAFRVAEGMLNYLEACYEKNGSWMLPPKAIGGKYVSAPA